MLFKRKPNAEIQKQQILLDYLTQELTRWLLAESPAGSAAHQQKVMHRVMYLEEQIALTKAYLAVAKHHTPNK